VRLSEIELCGEDLPGNFSAMTSESLNEAVLGCRDDLIIYVWQSEAPKGLVGPILEMLGNRTVQLTGRYRFRYDPPRTSSTGATAGPRGDFHLYQGDVEIAAWDDTGKARHGFEAGHRLPKKAYDAIVVRHPGVHGLKGRVLEHCVMAISHGEKTVSIDLVEAEQGTEVPN